MTNEEAMLNVVLRPKGGSRARAPLSPGSIGKARAGL